MMPMDVFHLTKVEYVDNILKEGLIPGAGKNARFDDEDDDEERLGVYVTSDWESILYIDGSFDRSEYALLQVDVRGIEDSFQKDVAYDLDFFEFTEEELAEGMGATFTWFTKSAVSRDRVKLLGVVRRGAYNIWSLTSIDSI